ncbi:hypothetical protein F5B22DRAFT_545444 [Xylaria bambusicola]|uniref:uncharacterized protein n=1 Tax=Xylaria bambusicola TaxID=326684 RepID=UPI002007F299|nr:uncharacterized protein F5B22DRAFT_545444 [Xylaria bambusicola]KAI0521629.1 hypothetical protein F5B22DRAFT_545444 [Xylaria bambusicola]
MVRPSQLRAAAAEANLNSADDDEATKQMDSEAAGKRSGDRFSTYWPPGWNYERFRKSTSLELIQGLSEGEYAKLQLGIREARSEREKGVSSGLVPLVAQTSSVAPDWLRQCTRRHRHQTWGFVAVRTASYDDAERWNEFKARIRSIMEVPFERDIKSISTSAVTEDASAAKAKLELRWIEDPALDGQTDPDILRDRYSQIRPSLPPGQSQHVFLVASKDAIASVLDDTNDQKTDEAAPFGYPPRWRPNAPYILAVSADADPGLEEGHEEREWFKPVFRVAAEVLVDEFWHLLDSDIMPLRRITRCVRGTDLDGRVLAPGDDDYDLEDLWWSMAPSPWRLRKRARGSNLHARATYIDQSR